MNKKWPLLRKFSRGHQSADSFGEPHRRVGVFYHDLWKMIFPDLRANPPTHPRQAKAFRRFQDDFLLTEQSVGFRLPRCPVAAAGAGGL